MPRPVTNSSQGVAGSSGFAGKSSSIQSPLRSAVSKPLSVWKRACSSGLSTPVSHKMCALARVACPHNSTSTVGVNQRKLKPSSFGTRKAVSERFISRATSRIHASGAGAGRMQTAAGFPANARLVNESTW